MAAHPAALSAGGGSRLGRSSRRGPDFTHSGAPKQTALLRAWPAVCVQFTLVRRRFDTENTAPGRQAELIVEKETPAAACIVAPADPWAARAELQRLFDMRFSQIELGDGQAVSSKSAWEAAVRHFFHDEGAKEIEATRRMLEVARTELRSKGDPATQAKGATLLWEIVERPHLQQEVVSSGCLQLLPALIASKQGRSAHRAACGVFANLADRSTFVPVFQSLGIVKAVAQLLDGGSGGASRAEEATGAGGAAPPTTVQAAGEGASRPLSPEKRGISPEVLEAIGAMLARLASSDDGLALLLRTRESLGVVRHLLECDHNAARRSTLGTLSQMVAHSPAELAKHVSMRFRGIEFLDRCLESCERHAKRVASQLQGASGSTDSGEFASPSEQAKLSLATGGALVEMLAWSSTVSQLMLHPAGQLILQRQTSQRRLGRMWIAADALSIALQENMVQESAAIRRREESVRTAAGMEAFQRQRAEYWRLQEERKRHIRQIESVLRFTSVGLWGSQVAAVPGIAVVAADVRRPLLTSVISTLDEGDSVTAYAGMGALSHLIENTVQYGVVDVKDDVARSLLSASAVDIMLRRLSEEQSDRLREIGLSTVSWLACLGGRHMLKKIWAENGDRYTVNMIKHADSLLNRASELEAEGKIGARALVERSVVLSERAAASIMWLASYTGRRKPVEIVDSVIAMLHRRDPQVLPYALLGVWALARDTNNRSEVGDRNAVEVLCRWCSVIRAARVALAERRKVAAEQSSSSPATAAAARSRSLFDALPPGVQDEGKLSPTSRERRRRRRRQSMIDLELTATQDPFDSGFPPEDDPGLVEDLVDWAEGRRVRWEQRTKVVDEVRRKAKLLHTSTVRFKPLSVFMARSHSPPPKGEPTIAPPADDDEGVVLSHTQTLDWLLHCAISSLWLLSFDSENLAKVEAMGGLRVCAETLDELDTGVQQPSLLYVSISTLWSAAQAAEVRAIVSHEELRVPERALIIARREGLPTRLRLQAAAALADIVRDPAVKARLHDEHGPHYLEELYVQYVKSVDLTMVNHGCSMIARTCTSKQSKYALAELRAPEALVAVLQRQGRGSADAVLSALHALLNLTTERRVQAKMGSDAVHIILARARDAGNPDMQAFAARIILNIKNHPANRTLLYREELLTRGAEWRKQALKPVVLEATDGGGPAHPGALKQSRASEASRRAKLAAQQREKKAEKFLRWVETVERGETPASTTAVRIQRSINSLLGRDPSGKSPPRAQSPTQRSMQRTGPEDVSDDADTSSSSDSDLEESLLRALSNSFADRKMERKGKRINKQRKPKKEKRRLKSDNKDAGKRSELSRDGSRGTASVPLMPNPPSGNEVALEKDHSISTGVAGPAKLPDDSPFAGLKGRDMQQRRGGKQRADSTPGNRRRSRTRAAGTSTRSPALPRVPGGRARKDSAGHSNTGSRESSRRKSAKAGGDIRRTSKSDGGGGKSSQAAVVPTGHTAEGAETATGNDTASGGDGVDAVARSHDGASESQALLPLSTEFKIGLLGQTGKYNATKAPEWMYLEDAGVDITHYRDNKRRVAGGKNYSFSSTSSTVQRARTEVLFQRTPATAELRTSMCRSIADLWSGEPVAEPRASSRRLHARAVQSRQAASAPMAGLAGTPTNAASSPESRRPVGSPMSKAASPSPRKSPTSANLARTFSGSSTLGSTAATTSMGGGGVDANLSVEGLPGFLSPVRRVMPTAGKALHSDAASSLAAANALSKKNTSVMMGALLGGRMLRLASKAKKEVRDRHEAEAVSKRKKQEEVYAKADDTSMSFRVPDRRRSSVLRSEIVQAASAASAVNEAEKINSLQSRAVAEARVDAGLGEGSMMAEMTTTTPGIKAMVEARPFRWGPPVADYVGAYGFEAAANRPMTVKLALQSERHRVRFLADFSSQTREERDKAREEARRLRRRAVLAAKRQKEREEAEQRRKLAEEEAEAEKKRLREENGSAEEAGSVERSQEISSPEPHAAELTDGGAEGGVMEETPEELMARAEEALQRAKTPPQHDAESADGGDGEVGDGAAAKTKSVRMFRFRHVHGAQLCKSLYQHYTLPDGTTYHYYHEDDLHELTTEVAVRAPAPPKTLDSIWLSQLPHPPPSEAPDVEEDVPDAFRFPTPPGPRLPEDTPRRLGPRVTLRVRAVEELKERRGIGARRTSGARDGIETAWSVYYSIFRPRAKQGHGRSFYNRGRSMTEAFDNDWRRISEKRRVQMLICRGREEAEWAAAVNEVCDTLEDHFELLCNVYDYFSSIAEGAKLAVDRLALNELLEAMGALDEPTHPVDIDALWRETNRENRHMQDSRANIDSALMRFEFIEFLLRLAIARYIDSDELDDVCDAFVTLIRRDLLPTVNRKAFVDADKFRKAFVSATQCWRTCFSF